MGITIRERMMGGSMVEMMRKYSAAREREHVEVLAHIKEGRFPEASQAYLQYDKTYAMGTGLHNQGVINRTEVFNALLEAEAVTNITVETQKATTTYNTQNKLTEEDGNLEKTIDAVMRELPKLKVKGRHDLYYDFS